MKKQRKNISNIHIITKLLVFLVILVSFNSIFLSAVQAAEVNTEVTEAYERWSNLPEEEKQKYIQPPLQPIPYEKDKKIYQQSRLAMFQDLRATYQAQYSLTGLTVKNQMDTGACWAFAATTMLESNYAKLKNATAPLLSPRHMSYASTYSAGFLNNATNPYGYNRNIGGGNTYLAMGYCTNGTGAVLETAMPFQNNENQINISEIQGKEVVQRVNSYKEFPAVYKTYSSTGITYHNGYKADSSYRVNYTESDVQSIRNKIKDHIIKYGAVTTGTYIDDNSEYFNIAKIQNRTSNYFSYNCDDETVLSNHAVTIIGWDDNFSMNNFNDAHKPKHNGAWIIQNSWGTNTLNDGCYYISYDDVWVERNIMGVIDSAKPEYDKIYQHDPLGWSSSRIFQTTAGTTLSTIYGANVFSRNTTNTKKEKLTQISFNITQTANIAIYANSTSDDLSKLTLLKNMGTLEPGYYTCKLDTPIEVTGSKFAVALKYSADVAEVPMEYNIKSNGGTSTYWDTATASNGESYISIDGVNGWTDVLDVGCKDSNICIKAFTNYENTSTSVAVTGVTLNTTTKQMEVGDNYTLTATVAPSNATNKNVVWTSSNTNVATVDQTGKITAKAVGNTTITVTTQDGSKTATCAVTVKAKTVSVTGVTLNTTSKTMEIGDTFILTATVAPTTATNKNVTWSSGNSNIATVDQTGKVTAKAVGNTNITVTTQEGSKTATCAVTVKEKTPTTISVIGVTLNETIKNIEVGDMFTLTATIAPSNATNKNVSWLSSNSSIATVDQTGKVTGVAAGNATITVTTQDGAKTATCAVTVKARTVSVTGVTLNETTKTLEVGDTGILIPTIAPTNATNKNVTWTSSNSNIAAVDNNGKITAKAVGSATITVTTQDGSKTASCQVTVNEKTPAKVSVTGVTLNETTKTVNTGDTFTLTATVAPENATNKGVTWTSSNTSIATVDQNGMVTAIAKGNATITVTTQDGSKTANCQVTVNERIVSVTGVEINVKVHTMKVGDTLEITAKVLPENATNKNVTWSSSNRNVATVNENGKVTAVAQGNVTITVTTQDGSKTASCQVTVQNADVSTVPVTGVTLDADLKEIEVGKTATLIATVSPDNATNKKVTWKSSDPEVATVDENGNIKAIAEGEAIITVTTQDGNKEVSCRVLINKELDPNYIKITKITLNTNGKTLYIGKTYQLEATITPDNATNQDIKWESTDESIAKVDQNGRVTAVSKGITTVIAKNTADGVSESCVITVLDKDEDENRGDHDIPNDPSIGDATIQPINPTDPTLAPGVIPQAGMRYFIMAMLVIITICGVRFAIRLYKVRDIK